MPHAHCDSYSITEPWRTVAGAVAVTAAGAGAFWGLTAGRRFGAGAAGVLTLATVAGVCWSHLSPSGPAVPPAVPGPLPAGSWIALTFDDGPQEPETARILDALAAAGATATFFLLGERARAHPDLVRRIAAAGHSLGIHGDRHEPVVFQSAGTLAEGIAAARAAIRAAAPAAEARFFRPPWGLRRPGLVRFLRRRGLEMALWNLDSRDYASGGPAAIRSRVAGLAVPHRVVLMHDGGRGSRHTADALPGLLDDLGRKGLRCVSLDALRGRG